MSNNTSCGRPWTSQEDDLLRTAVAIYGDNTEKWKTIAFSVPGRTNKACRKRWLHSLSPSVKKSAWTLEEDQLLLSLFEKYPNKWSRIAREIHGRTDDACSKRYREALDPNLKKDGWTAEEDRRLLDALIHCGGPTNPKWVLIGQELQRSSLGCRNRWRLLERKRKAAVRQDGATQAQADAQDMFAQGSQEDIWPLLSEVGSSSYWEAALNSLGVAFEKFPGSESNQEFSFIQSSGERTETSHQETVTTTEPALTESDATGERRRDLRGAEDSVPFPSVATEAYLVPPPSEACFGSQRLQAATQTAGTAPPAVTSRAIDESSGNTFGTSAPDAVDLNASRDDDSFCIYDIDPQDSSQAGDNRSHEASEEPHCTLETPGDVQTSDESFADETENLGSLGTLAQAASTLSPSPLAATGPEEARLNCHSIVVPPRKRRRTAADSPGVHIIADVSGRPRAEPKLSSSLPVGGDPSILAYVCGHSTCFPAGAGSRTACFSTSGELSSHYKDQHMHDAGTNDETPFRCGLKGCAKGWKSINGLQYHLQIAKVHYRHVWSQTASARKLVTDNSPASSTSATNISEEIPRNGTRRLHVCPHPGCLKEYKQLSGLRYHLSHGHPKDVPTQLDTVPPRIAKQLGVHSNTQALNEMVSV